MTIPDIDISAIGYAAGVAGVVAAMLMWLKQRWSKTKVDTATDTARIDVIGILRSIITTKEGEANVLREQNIALAKERNDAMFKLGEQGAQIIMFTTLLSDIRKDQTRHAEQASLETGQAIKRADEAFKEANTVNQKIDKIGLAVKDGSLLNEGLSK